MVRITHSIIVKCAVKGDLSLWNAATFSQACGEVLNAAGKIRVVDTQRSVISKVRMQATLLVRSGAALATSIRTVAEVLDGNTFAGFRVTVEDVTANEADVYIDDNDRPEWQCHATATPRYTTCHGDVRL